jgi:hypothetical protein
MCPLRLGPAQVHISRHAMAASFAAHAALPHDAVIRQGGWRSLRGANDDAGAAVL